MMFLGMDGSGQKDVNSESKEIKAPRTKEGLQDESQDLAEDDMYVSWNDHWSLEYCKLHVSAQRFVLKETNLRLILFWGLVVWHRADDDVGCPA